MKTKILYGIIGLIFLISLCSIFSYAEDLGDHIEGKEPLTDNTEYDVNVLLDASRTVDPNIKDPLTSKLEQNKRIDTIVITIIAILSLAIITWLAYHFISRKTKPKTEVNNL